MAGDNINNRITRAASYVASNRGNIPVFRLILGVFLIGFFVLALMMDVQTSEAFLLSGGQVTFQSLNWTLVLQPVDLFQGHIHDWNIAKAIMWGWGCLLVYLVCVVGETTVHGRLGNIFKTGAFLIVAFDFWTNLNYGTLPSGWGGQIGFAAITSFIVAFFGVIGLNLIFGAITEMFRP
jgi:hypothetical protein